MTWPAVKSTEPFPDIIDGLKILFAQWFPELATQPDDDFRVGRVFPPNLQDRLPFVRMADIGGNDDGLTDTPLIDIDVFHQTFAQARDLSKGIQVRLLGYPHRVGSLVIDEVRTAMRPHDVPWDDDRVRRFYSSYQISARR
jgi:hypothetical protein